MAPHAFNDVRVPLIAIVDDDLSIRNALQRLMKASGYQTVVFSSAREFLRSPAFEQTTCLLLDVQMPELTGFDLVDIVNALHASIPTIFITAHPDEDTRARAIAAGAVGLLEKPFDDNALLSLIEKSALYHAQ
jgi:FixJ family two-component response regulator